MRRLLPAVLLLALPGCELPGAQARDGDRPPEWRSSAAQPMTTTRAVPVRDETCRMVLRLSVGGPQLRLRLSNVMAQTPLVLTAVTAGLRSERAGARPGTLRPVTVGGMSRTTLAPGEVVTTDPVPLPVAAGDDVLVSFAVEGPTRVAAHRFGAATGWCSGPGTGDRTGDEDGAAFGVASREALVLDDVAVAAPAGAPRTVVGVGDSLTDAPLPPDGYPRWTDALVRALPGTPVVNAAIAGNRVLLGGGFGRPLVERFDRDVLQRPGVGTVVLLAGTNDLARDLPAGRLQEELAGLTAATRARGLRVALVTIPPAAGRTAGQSQARREVNTWIRSGQASDVVVDADEALRDPADPERLAPAYDHGDGLHLSPAGHRALAAAVAAALT